MKETLSSLTSRGEKHMSRVAASIAALSGWRRWALAFLAGSLAVLSLAPFFVVPVLWVSFPCLIWLLESAGGQKNPLRAAAAVGWWFGFGFHLAGLYWIGSAFLVDAARYAWMLPFVAVLMPGGLALFTMIAGVFSRLAFERLGGWGRIAAFAVIWMALEWLRGHILTGFPWNLGGYAWAGSLAVSQSVSIIGIYGLGLLTVLCAAAPVVFFETKGGARFAACCFAILLAFGMWGAVRLHYAASEMVDGVGLRLVQPSIPQADKWKPENRLAIFQTYLAMSAEEPAPKDSGHAITHIIWPESAVPLFLGREPGARTAIGQMLGPNRTLLTGSIRVQHTRGQDGQEPESKYFNALYQINDEGEITASYDKYHLVPFGEYLPADKLLRALGLSQLVSSAGGYSAGPGPRALGVPGAGKVLPMICYEAIFPGRLRANLSGTDRPDWILNVTNDAWFGNSSGPWQHFHQARMRAIEEGLPVVRSANTGISGVFDPYGRTSALLALKERGVLDASLPVPIKPTIYAKVGDWVFAIMMLAAAILAAASKSAGLRPAE